MNSNSLLTPELTQHSRIIYLLVSELIQIPITDWIWLTLSTSAKHASVGWLTVVHICGIVGLASLGQHSGHGLLPDGSKSLPDAMLILIFFNAVQNRNTVLEIPTGPPVWGRQLWGRTGNFFFNFMFMICDSRHEDLQIFWLSFKHCWNIWK